MPTTLPSCHEQALVLYDVKHKGVMMGTVPFEQVYDQIVTFAREAGTRRVVLFGSRARDTKLPKVT